MFTYTLYFYPFAAATDSSPQLLLAVIDADHLGRYWRQHLSQLSLLPSCERGQKTFWNVHLWTKKNYQILCFFFAPKTAFKTHLPPFSFLSYRHEYRLAFACVRCWRDDDYDDGCNCGRQLAGYCCCRLTKYSTGGSFLWLCRSDLGRVLVDKRQNRPRGA